MNSVRWLLRVFADDEHTKLLTVMWFPTVRAMASVLNEPIETVSNTFHGQIRPRGVLRYCDIHRCDRPVPTRLQLSHDVLTCTL